MRTPSVPLSPTLPARGEGVGESAAGSAEVLLERHGSERIRPPVVLLGREASERIHKSGLGGTVRGTTAPGGARPAPDPGPPAAGGRAGRGPALPRGLWLRLPLRRLLRARAHPGAEPGAPALLGGLSNRGGRHRRPWGPLSGFRPLRRPLRDRPVSGPARLPPPGHRRPHRRLHPWHPGRADPRRRPLWGGGHQPYRDPDLRPPGGDDRLRPGTKPAPAGPGPCRRQRPRRLPGAVQDPARPAAPRPPAGALPGRPGISPRGPGFPARLRPGLLPSPGHRRDGLASAALSGHRDQPLAVSHPGPGLSPAAA